MSYISESLLKGEEVVYQTKMHLAILLGPVFLFIPALFAGIASAFLPNSTQLVMLCVLCTIVGIAIGIKALVKYMSSEFGITNKRVLLKVGLVGSNTMEIFLTRIESVQVRQGVLGSIMGYGSIIIDGTGGSRDQFLNIKSPIEFRKIVQEQMEIVQEAKS